MSLDGEKNVQIKLTQYARHVTIDSDTHTELWFPSQIRVIDLNQVVIINHVLSLKSERIIRRHHANPRRVK